MPPKAVVIRVRCLFWPWFTWTHDRATVEEARELVATLRKHYRQHEITILDTLPPKA